MLNCDKIIRYNFLSWAKKVVWANQCEQTDKKESMAAVLKGTTLTLMIKPVLYSKMTKGIVVVNHCIEVKFSKLPNFFSLLHFLILAQLAQSPSSISAHRTNEPYFDVIIPSEEKTEFAFKSTQKRCSSKCLVTGADHEVILILTVVLELRSWV